MQKKKKKKLNALAEKLNKMIKLHSEAQNEV